MYLWNGTLRHWWIYFVPWYGNVIYQENENLCICISFCYKRKNDQITLNITYSVYLAEMSSSSLWRQGLAKFRFPNICASLKHFRDLVLCLSFLCASCTKMVSCPIAGLLHSSPHHSGRCQCLILTVALIDDNAQCRSTF